MRDAVYLCRLAIIAFIFSGTAIAAESEPSDEWQIDLTLYLWGAAISGTTVSGNDVEVQIADIIDNVDFAFMGSFGGHKGRWSALADVIYLDLSQQKNGTVNLMGQPVNTSAVVDLTGLVINFIGGYTVVQTEKLNFDVIFGARYLGLDTDLDFTIGNQPIPFSGSGSNWDGIIGARGHVDLAEKWYFSYTLDGGTGDSDFTWQARTGFGYQLPRLDIGFGYRYLRWEFAANDPGANVFRDLDFKGPYAGVKFIF